MPACSRAGSSRSMLHQAAAGLLHPGRHPGRRLTSRPSTSGSASRQLQPVRPHRGAAALAARLALGSPGRAATLTELPPHHDAARLRSAGPCRAGRLPGSHAPGGGHDPRLLRAEHMANGSSPTTVTANDTACQPSRYPDRRQAVRSVTADRARLCSTPAASSLRGALETGDADRLGLDRDSSRRCRGGRARPPDPSPFPDEVARALADEANLRQLAEAHDPERPRTARRLGDDPRSPDVA